MKLVQFPDSDSTLSRAEAYRRRAAECLRQARATRSLVQSARYRRMANAYAAIAREEDWLNGVPLKP
ncbi:MAG: hypothetical protein IRZ09_02765 [Variibacter sp.]|nr:hypothetical protein [Variibacter sp.]